MSDWSEVGAGDVRDAMAECDRLGSREFLARYRFGRAHDAALWHGGQEYDARALLGLAYLRSTGRTLSGEEFATGGEDAAVLRLRSLGFDVVVDEKLTPPPPKPRKAASPRRAAAPRTATARAPKAPPAPKRVVVKGRSTSVNQPEPTICPRCFMALPATGLCDNCD